MDKKDLQKKLNKPYSTENWREVVQFVFPNVQILNPPMVIPIKNDKVEQFRQLGSVQLHDGKMLLLFELKLKENVNIIRNRVELNKIVSEYIDKDLAHGVLSIYEKGGDDYRFTFTAKSTEYDEIEQDFINKETDKKRYTYVLGKNESCKTPAQRFYELSENKNKAEIKDIKVTKVKDANGKVKATVILTTMVDGKETTEEKVFEGDDLEVDAKIAELGKLYFFNRNNENRTLLCGFFI